jgi:hypothetical protein
MTYACPKEWGPMFASSIRENTAARVDAIGIFKSLPIAEMHNEEVEKIGLA